MRVFIPRSSSCSDRLPGPLKHAAATWFGGVASGLSSLAHGMSDLRRIPAVLRPGSGKQNLAEAV
jgi:hypothetical protein